MVAATIAVSEHVPPGYRQLCLGQHLIPVFQFVRSALRADNDPPYLFIATNPVEVHDVDREARITHLLDADVEYERLVKLWI